MHVFIVYCHPSPDSFTREARDEFIRGLSESNHSWEISDLYAMNFRTDMTEAEYQREAEYRNDLPVPEDVRLEQEKIGRCDALVFVYPVFWTEAPAKLVGWFDRVWSYGFAYGDRTMKKLRHALVLCTAGNTVGNLRERGHLQGMERVMLGDRIFDRAGTSRMVVFDGMSKKDMAVRNAFRGRHLLKAFELGRDLGKV